MSMSAATWPDGRSRVHGTRHGVAEHGESLREFKVGSGQGSDAAHVLQPAGVPRFEQGDYGAADLGAGGVHRRSPGSRGSLSTGSLPVPSQRGQRIAGRSTVGVIRWMMPVPEQYQQGSWGV